MTDSTAAVNRGTRTITLATGDVPDPAAGEVQIAVAYTGICGTDLHIFHGDMDHRVSPPGIIGHEMSGTIAALGPDVTGWSVGELFPMGWVHYCSATNADLEARCEIKRGPGTSPQRIMRSRSNLPSTPTLVR